MNKLTIIAVAKDGNDIISTPFHVYANDGMTEDDILQAIRDASMEFCSTDAGREVLEHDTHGDFNFGDFVDYVPKTIMARHGFTIGHVSDRVITVDHDEKLIPDYFPE